MARQQSFSCFLLNTGWHDIFGVRVEKILSYAYMTVSFSEVCQIAHFFTLMKTHLALKS